MKKIFFLLIFVLFCSIVYAPMPPTHDYICENALKISPNNNNRQLIEQYPMDYLACNILTDYSVFVYYEEGINTISSKYKQSHTQILCKKMSESAINDRQKVCSLGVCSHHVQDAAFHTGIVAFVIGRTKMPNGLIHIFAEEAINDKIPEKNRHNNNVKQALVSTADYHYDFWESSVAELNPEFNFRAMYEAFVNEVTENEKYSVGFRGFTAVPFEVHLGLIGLFLLGLVVLAFVIKKKAKGYLKWVNGFAGLLSICVVILIILAYVLFYMGKLWIFFQVASTPISMLMPISGYEKDINLAIQETKNVIINGADHVLAVTPDPAGEQALIQATNAGLPFRIILFLIVLGLIALFIYLNFRGVKK